VDDFWGENPARYSTVRPRMERLFSKRNDPLFYGIVSMVIVLTISSKDTVLHGSLQTFTSGQDLPEMHFLLCACVCVCVCVCLCMCVFVYVCVCART